jgi:hypothetical protein
MKKSIKMLVDAVKKPATRFDFRTDLWNCTPISQYGKDKLNLTLSKSTILRRLHEENLSYRVPEKFFVQANVKLQSD